MYQLGIDTTQVSTTPLFDLGQLGATHDGKVWKYVQYDTGSGAVAGVANGVAYYYTDDGYKNNVVTSDLSDSVGLGAGVLPVAATDGVYLWIQIRGPATLAIALTAGADGNALTPTGSTDGTLDVSALVTDHICAQASDISDKEIVCNFPF